MAIASFKQSVDTITIYGPQDVLDKYEFYDGLTIDLSQLKQSGTMELDIKPGKDIATVDPATVIVRLYDRAGGNEGAAEAAGYNDRAFRWAEGANRAAGGWYVSMLRSAVRRICWRRSEPRMCSWSRI